MFEQRGELNHGVQLATALIKLTTRLGLLYSAHQSLERTLHYLAQLDAPPAEIQADLLMEHAGLLYETHDWEQAWQAALASYEKALALCQEAPNPDLEAKLLASIASLYLTLGQPELALNYYQQALELRQSEDNPREVDLTHLGLGHLYLRTGQLKDDSPSRRSDRASIPPLLRFWPRQAHRRSVSACTARQRTHSQRSHERRARESFHSADP